jgi:hypothetical protein
MDLLFAERAFFHDALSDSSKMPQEASRGFCGGAA